MTLSVLLKLSVELVCRCVRFWQVESIALSACSPIWLRDILMVASR